MTSHDTAQAALPERAVRELAAAAAALVREHDVIGTITNLLGGCVECVQGAAAGILMTPPGGDGLEFLAATDHRAQHLELYQVQVDEGPGIDCVSSGQQLTVQGPREIADRWPPLSEPFRAAGFTGVHAAPMTWQGDTLGALNLFFTQEESAADAEPVAQAFADFAALVIVHSSALSAADIAARTKAALEERTVIERAKGVIAYSQDLSMDTAFERLLALAREQTLPLTVVAAAVVNRAATANRRQH